MATLPQADLDTPLVAYVLRRADDALVLGHRLSEWCGHAPMLEEDIALTNIALDLVGEARSLYEYASQLGGSGLNEDQLAYLREVSGYRNCLLVEQPNGDFAVTIARQVLFSAFIDPYWRAMSASKDATLAAIAAKAEKESAYHLRHAGEWLIRLGDGTAESHDRAQAAVDDLWMFTGELFEIDPIERELIGGGVAVDPAGLRVAFDGTLKTILEQATLERPKNAWMQSGGRKGRHTEHLGFLLADLQYLQRAYPGVTW